MHRYFWVWLLLAACSNPLREVVSGERAGDRDAVEPTPRVPVGSARDLACELVYELPEADTPIEATWRFRERGSSTDTELHRASRVARGKGRWFVYIDSKGWRAGTYTCSFETGRDRKMASIEAP